MNIVKKEESIPADTQIILQMASHDSAMRIDQFMATQFPAYSRSFFKRLIDTRIIFLNNKLVTKAGILVNPLDTVSFRLPALPSFDTCTDKAQNTAIDILYTHEHFLVVYKPAGVTVHKPHLHSTEITLVDWLLAHYTEIAHVGTIDRPGIVHRLDKNTSGLLVVARTNYAHTLFSDLFKKRALTKTYRAFVKGHPSRKGTINLAIGRHPIVKTKMIALDPANSLNRSINKLRTAQTDYSVLHYFDTYTFVEITLITGRTHQIRAHFAAIGHPVIGDTVYGEESFFIDRQALHAYQLAFIFDGISFSFTCPLPDDMNKLVQQLFEKSEN